MDARSNVNEFEEISKHHIGIAIALLSVVPTYMIYYVVQPMAGDFVVRQVAFDGALVVILGIIAVFLNKSGTAGGS